MNNPLFTLQRIFTLYHHEIIDKKPEVNSVNSKTWKNFLSPLTSPERTVPERAQITKVKSRLFTLHQPFTTYRYDIKKKNEKVNSVNSYMEKKNFTDVQYYPG